MHALMESSASGKDNGEKTPILTCSYILPDRATWEVTTACLALSPKYGTPKSKIMTARVFFLLPWHYKYQVFFSRTVQRV